MLNYDLYINLTSNYTDDSDYFSVDVENEIELGEEMIDKMPVYRKSWNEITVKNKPYEYKNTLQDRYKLYDLIMQEDPDTTFYIKFVHGSETVYGYFGQVDCRVDENTALIKIKPAIIDQYTDFIENYDEKIDIFGDKNLIKNGEFKVWTDGVPDGWLPGFLGAVTRDSLLSYVCARLGKGIFGSSLYQGITINSNSQISISFRSAYIGEYTGNQNLEFSVSLNGTSQYNLQSDGSWIESPVLNKIEYRTNAVPLPKSSVTEKEFKTFNLITQKPPVSGTLLIAFYNEGVSGNFVYISDVQVIASSVGFLEISLNLQNKTLVPKPQEEIINVNAGHGILFAVRVKNDNLLALEQYFNENGSPNSVALSGNLAPNDGSQYYQDWLNTFDSDINSRFHKGEISKLTLMWDIVPATRYSFIRGYAEFTREESYKTDEYDESDELIPPVGSGWVALDERNSSEKRLWVRTPFDGAYTGEWNLGTKITTPGKFMGFDYRHLITSEKIYPVNEDSRTVETAVDFRDICRKIYRSTHNSLLDKEVYSAFFWNESPYIADLRIAGNANYVTRQDNKLNNIACIHTTALKTEVDQSSNDQILEVSFKDFFDDLKVKFPDLIWFVDENKNLHLEHIKFVDLTKDYLNILTDDYKYVGAYERYEFDPEEIYGTYEYKEINSGFQDFAYSRVTFDKIVTNKRNKDMRKEIIAKILSTDIQYAVENPNSLENGIIMVAYDDQSTVKYGKGQKTKTIVMNGDLAISTLLSSYSKYEGVWRKGYINDELTYFHYTKKVKKGDPIRLKGIVADTFFLTALGIATTVSKKYDYAKETTEITPVYRHYDYFLVVDTNNLVAI